MATLEDSSSYEGEYEPDVDGDCEKAAPSKQGATENIDSDICPSQRKHAYTSHVSTNTGPKGVMEDYERFKQLQTEDHEGCERQRIAKKLTMIPASARELEERKKQNELDAQFVELMSDDFLFNGDI